MSKNPDDFILGIIGVRDLDGSEYTNLAYIRDTLDTYIRRNEIPENFRIVTGGGRGVESLVIQWAKSNAIDYRLIPPSIEKLGAKRAFTVRNNQIVSACHEAVIFWDGYTEVMIEAMRSASFMRKRVTICPLI